MSKASAASDGIPAVYLHGGPGSGCQPDHRRLFDPERFHAVLFDQRGAGRSRPKGRREDNTLPHLIADMEMIREKFGFERWMIVGGSWGATLALAYAQAHPDRVSGIVLRATFLGTRQELEGAFLDALPRFYPGLCEDFLSVLPRRRTRAAARCLLPPHPRSRSGGARPGRAGLARYRAHPFRTHARPRPARSRIAELIARPARHAVHGSALFPERLLHEAEPAAAPKPESSNGIPGIIVQGRYDLLCPPATSHALAAAVARVRNSSSSKAPAIRCTIPASGTP